jgi:hypothetical protein
MNKPIENQIIEEVYLPNMKLAIDGESVNIYVDRGDDKEPIHIVYWHLDEVEEDAEVAISMANAVNIFHTDKKLLLEKLGYIRE